MTDPDAPKLPSSDAKAGAAGSAPPESRPGTIPPRPAIITGPGTVGPPTLGMKPATPTLGAPPPLGGLPNAPSLGSLGKPPSSLGAPAGLPPLGKPGAPGLPNVGAPNLGAPNGGAPNLGAPNLGAPNVGAPNLGAPNLGAPNLGAPNLGGAPNLSPPGLSVPGVSPPGAAAPTFGAPNVAPSAAAPASTSASASANAAAKPRTRGWTMFMEVTEDEAGAPATPGVPLPGAPVTGAPAGSGVPASGTLLPIAQTPVAPTPMAVVGTPAPTPAPSPAAAATADAATGEVKPSTRGWTMIMDEPADVDPAQLGITTPAAAASPPPPSPTTRGWTMLEELNDALPASPTPVTPVTAGGAVAASAPMNAPSEASGVSSAPSSRGWTMFMEAELQGTPKPEAEPDAEPEFYEGQVQTDSGTVVTFAPTAAEPNAGFRARTDGPELGAGAQEPMTSFGARLRGEDAAPSVASLTPQSAPSPAAEIPSFAGNNLGFVAVKPSETRPAEPKFGDASQSDPLDADLEAPGGGNTKLIVIGVIVVAIVVAIILATT